MPHIHKDIDFTVSVFIVRDAHVLFHTHRKYGMLLPPGGHIELDEDPNEAALREVKEECGLSIELLPPREKPVPLGEEGLRELVEPFYFNIHQESPNHRHADFVFFAYSDHGNVVPEHSEDAWQWMSADAIDAAEHIWPSTRFYAKAALVEVAKRRVQ